MDNLIILVFVFALIVVFILLLFIKAMKGKIGEKIVSRGLEHLPEGKYRVLNDVIIPTQKGTSQMDHVVVSEYGIFVIETKFYKGWIFGGEHSEYWTQNIYGKKNQFYNPILQNAGHVRALKNLLKGYDDVFIFPIVAFSSQATLKVNVNDACVIYWSQLMKIIMCFNEKRLSQQQVRDIYRTIDEAKLDNKSWRVQKQHKQNVLSANVDKRVYVRKDRCPRCGGNLVKRQGKYGTFYGCSNYPNCKFTRDISC